MQRRLETMLFDLNLGQASMAASRVRSEATRRRAGLRMSFEDVYRDHCAGIMGTIRQRGVPERDALDVCQDVFEAIHLNLPKFEGRSKLSTWMHTICQRKISDYWRKPRRRWEVLDGGTAPEPTAAGKQEQRSMDQQMVTWLQQALASLPEKQREVFVMYEIEELPMSEVADIARCRLFTAYGRLRKARRNVEAFLGKRDLPDGASGTVLRSCDP